MATDVRATGIFRVYTDDELGEDGYPRAWHRLALSSNLTDAIIEFLTGDPRIGIKDIVRAEAEHRCVRCGHPYRNGEHGNGEWSPCDEQCTHGSPRRWWTGDEWHDDEHWLLPRPQFRDPDLRIEARWRILTVHHLNGNKADCRWFNLVALCQRCHLTIQGRVVMNRAFILEHSSWFKPYAAGFYAWKYLNEELSRSEALARMDELLALERLA